jgi:nucleotide-binding universal stress UspA family protein
MSMDSAEILVALDGSAFAERALDLAADIARRRSGRLFLYAAVVDRKPGEIASDFDERVYEPLEGDVTRRLEKAQEYLDGVAARIQDDELVVRAHATVEPDAAEGIVRQAASHGVEMIVLSSHGRGGIGRWLLGSVAEHVLRSTSIPVLVLPARDSS